MPRVRPSIFSRPATSPGISDKVRFTNMVPVGARVRARQKMLSVTPRGGGLQLVSEITIEIEGEKRAACVAETISIIYDR